MKERILKLREEGKTYNEIVALLDCSKSTVAYHCGEGQKEKTRNRTNKRRENILLAKVDSFKYKPRKNAVECIRKYQKKDNNFSGDKVNKEIDKTFTWEDVLEKYGEDTICYLSGEKINLYENNYQLDHKVPTSRGGDNNFENLGITHKVVNQMKSDLTPEELIEWCIKILEYNNYKITKK